MNTVAIRRIASYGIDAVLGRGRRSTVYLASKGERTCALKVALHGDFVGEFEAARAIADSCVIRVFEHGRADNAAFLAMECAAGGSLADIQRRQTSQASMALMRQAAEAAGRMHRKGWVHRDIKPANLLLRDDGSVTLGDLGCARMCGACDPQEHGTVVGTPRYAAPEQLQGAAADPTADVYSLGVLLHELLTGAPPYPGETLTEVIFQHRCAPLPRLHQSLHAWQPLLQAMLAKDPRERLPDGHAVLEQLRRLRRGGQPW
jgi:serine/threonine-protein kinase PpkA